MKYNLGLIHIYTGDGKGKTSASLGLALRALGHNYKILLTQFFKFETGEKNVLSKLPNIEYLQFNVPSDFFVEYNEKIRIESKKKFHDFLKSLEEKIKLKDYDIIILDEIIYALHMNLITEEELKNFILKKPESTELILTGRNYPKSILELADYVTEMKKIKHPFEEKSIEARKGIEY